MTSLGFLLKPFKNVSHNITFVQLFHYYALLYLFFEKFLGTCILCIFFFNKCMSSKKSVFIVSLLFIFWPFFVKDIWVLHGFVGFFYISISVQKLCVTWVFLSWLIDFNNETFGMQNVRFSFSSLYMPNNYLTWLFLAALCSHNRGLHGIVT